MWTLLLLIAVVAVAIWMSMGDATVKGGDDDNSPVMSDAELSDIYRRIP